MAQPVKPSASKTASTSVASAAAAPKQAAAAPAPAKTSAAERAKMIAEAAYFLAQKRGFAPGSHHEDWLAAEQQIDALLRKRT